MHPTSGLQHSSQVGGAGAEPADASLLDGHAADDGQSRWSPVATTSPKNMRAGRGEVAGKQSGEGPLETTLAVCEHSERRVWPPA